MILGKLENFIRFIDFRLLSVCVQNRLYFVFLIWEMVEKIKMDVVGLLLILIMKKHFSVDFAKFVLLFIFKTKSLLSPLLFSKNLKTQFYILWR